MPTLESARQKRGNVLQQIAEASYGYPNDEFPDREVTTNFPEEQMGVRVRSGGWLYPDIVVTDEPGHFIALAGDLALTHEVTNQTAIERWKPLAQAAPLVLYVPMGQSGRAIRLCRINGIKLHRLIAYRQRPASFGLDLQQAYSGPDLFKPIAGLLPPALRPMAYRNERKVVADSYLQPLPASRTGDVPALAAPAQQPAATLALASGLASGLADEHGHGAHDAPESHLPPPSLAPVLFALGLIMTAAGAVFVGELLGVGITLIIISAVRWLLEDMGYFEAGRPRRVSAASVEDHARRVSTTWHSHATAEHLSDYLCHRPDDDGGGRGLHLLRIGGWNYPDCVWWRRLVPGGHQVL